MHIHLPSLPSSYHRTLWGQSLSGIALEYLIPEIQLDICLLKVLSRENYFVASDRLWFSEYLL